MMYIYIFRQMHLRIFKKMKIFVRFQVYLLLLYTKEKGFLHSYLIQGYMCM